MRDDKWALTSFCFWLFPGGVVTCPVSPTSACGPAPACCTSKMAQLPESSIVAMDRPDSPPTPPGEAPALSSTCTVRQAGSTSGARNRKTSMILAGHLGPSAVFFLLDAALGLGRCHVCALCPSPRNPRKELPKRSRPLFPSSPPSHHRACHAHSCHCHCRRPGRRPAFPPSRRSTPSTQAASPGAAPDAQLPDRTFNCQHPGRSRSPGQVRPSTESFIAD